MAGTAGTNISAFGAGDLDGDKKEDVLVLISTSETETVIAKRGFNGEHIWTESVSGTAPNLIVSAGDLDSDHMIWYMRWDTEKNRSCLSHA